MASWRYDMKVARVPFHDGMMFVHLENTKYFTRPNSETVENYGWQQGRRGYVFDLEDRATFLLCCDVAERRGKVLPVNLRSAHTWDDASDRALAQETLGRILRDTAPIEPRKEGT
jgi:hypothetical protein